MFTGLVEAVGEVVATRDADAFREIRIRVPSLIDDLREGSSIATQGVCITAREVLTDGFVADLSGETLSRTTLGRLGPGDRVNLERALRADARLGGHIVQGHVDGVGEILEFERRGDDWNLVIGYDAKDQSRLVPKGSVAVDGISLTVAALTDQSFSVAIIPFTFENTTLGSSRKGDAVNLEFDVLAKYVGRLLEPYLEARADSWRKGIPS